MLKIYVLPALCIFCLLFFVSCNDSNSESSQVVSEESNPVEIIFGENYSNLTSEDYEELTVHAIDLYEEETSVFKPDRENIKKWFIRYYIQKYEYNEDWSEEEMFQMAEERFEYEQAWINYAEEEYSVSVSDEEVDSQAEYNLEIYQNNLPPSIRGMSEAMNLSVEEFMIEFDRDHAKRTVLWETLEPVLLQKYEDEDARRLDSVYLGQKYKQEVESYLEDYNT
jgi:hypothetical protein